MDVLNFISWIKSLKITSTLPTNTLIPVGVKDINRGDTYLPAVITSQNLIAQVSSAIPAGAQGPIGPQGVPGPVGPAGLNWQGAWSNTGVYVVDDAVSFGGASYFCINPVGPFPTNPALDTTHWALLAAQGATGPQGPQGIQGPAGSSATSFSTVPSGAFTLTGGTELVLMQSTIPGNTFNNTTNPILTIKAVLQKFAGATTYKTRIYITNSTQNLYNVYSPSGGTLIASTDTSVTGSSQRAVKIEKDIFFSGVTGVFLNNGTLPNTGFSDSGIGSNSGATHNSGIFDNGMQVTSTPINWSLNTYIVVTIEGSVGTTTIGSRFLSVVRI